MNADNSIARSARDLAAEGTPRPFEIPPDLAARYEVRSTEENTQGERRIGLFVGADRQTPAIEIGTDRIVARREDPETVASLVTIARHNGWDRIDVDGSPEFRKAMWHAGSREGLRVSGYEPSFAEQEQVDALRATVRQPAAEVPGQAPTNEPAVASASPAAPVASRDGADRDTGEDEDRRLLLLLSRHTADRRAIAAAQAQPMDSFQREVQSERVERNREALEGALDRALDSPTLVRTFEDAGYAPAALRSASTADIADSQLADAIDRVRASLERSADKVGTSEAAALDDLAADRQDQSVAASTERLDRPAGSAAASSHAGHARGALDEDRDESRHLAELFLHGDAAGLAAEPRLANALQAQTVMEQHIDELFDGDAARSAANLESRQMISDVLRRGLDVSVREPSPVRQIEPLHAPSDPER